MNRCPISYRDIPDGTRYSKEGLKSLSPRLRDLQDLPYSAEEQRQEAVARAAKMSIQGMQPKLSAKLDVSRERFEIVDMEGLYILKPQSHYPELPQNEDLTMRLANTIGVEVPLHGMVYSKDGTLTYFIRRFDRGKKNERIALEDFAQISGSSRDTKYNSSMERVASVLEEHCTFPLVEKVKLFRLTLFNFLVGNEDMHLKNFSLIRRDGKIELSPAYDLVNSTIALTNAVEELALPLAGKKRNLSRSLFLDYFGKERLGLNDAVIKDVLATITRAFGNWEDLLHRSFLSADMKKKYSELLSARRSTLEL